MKAVGCFDIYPIEAQDLNQANNRKRAREFLVLFKYSGQYILLLAFIKIGWMIGCQKILKSQNVINLKKDNLIKNP